MHRPLCAAACLALAAAAAPALAQSSDCTLDYPTFEVAVPHSDLETCPPAMQVEGAFCRISLNAHVLTIFAFSEETDCLVASRGFFEDEYTLTLK
jgi:hypothetical protein